MQPKEVKPASYHCAYCGEENHTVVDPSQGKTQTYIEDCQICCQPNELNVQFDEWAKEYIVQARPAQ